MNMIKYNEYRRVRKGHLQSLKINVAKMGGVSICWQ